VKFLTDTQTPKQFGDTLTKLGWDVETVYDHSLQSEPDDAVVLHRATQLERVLVTFDYLRGQ
jgi:predicted nuclease of predicted toxin-antitoxin system